MLGWHLAFDQRGRMHLRRRTFDLKPGYPRRGSVTAAVWRPDERVRAAPDHAIGARDEADLESLKPHALLERCPRIGLQLVAALGVAVACPPGLVRPDGFGGELERVLRPRRGVSLTARRDDPAEL